MTQIEQIKAEIERLTEVTGYALSEYENGRRSAMYDIRKQLTEYINSLPTEQPSEDLKKAAEEYASMSQIAYKGIHCTYVDDQHAFIAGADWQKERVIEKAYDWLNDNFFKYGEDGTDNNGCSILYDFKKAMEDEQ
jgi:transcriptional regulator with XRE-family HTH domain